MAPHRVNSTAGRMGPAAVVTVSQVEMVSEEMAATEMESEGIEPTAVAERAPCQVTVGIVVTAVKAECPDRHHLDGLERGPELVETTAQPPAARPPPPAWGSLVDCRSRLRH